MAANALQCWTGAESTKTKFDCVSPVDKSCQKVTTAGVAAYSCAATDTTGCNTALTIETCTCKTDLCNSAQANAGKLALALLTTFIIKMLA